MGQSPAPAPVTYVPEPQAPTIYQSKISQEDFDRASKYIDELKAEREKRKAERYLEVGTPEEIGQRMKRRENITEAAYESSMPEPEIDYTAGLDPAKLNNLETFLKDFVDHRTGKSTLGKIKKGETAPKPAPAPAPPPAPTRSRMSLSDISDKYGQFATFGHRDYQAAKDEGYSNDEILNYLNADMSRLHPDNRPGGSAGLYEEIKRGNVDLSKAVNIVR